MRETRFSAAAAAFFAFAGGTTGVLADQVSLIPVADNTMFESATGSLANGAGTAMFAGRNSAATGSIRRGLIRFDFSSLPAGATITDASLRLNDSAANVAPADVGLFRVLQSWGEGASLATGAQGGGAPSQPGDATWIHRSFSTVFWTNIGGDFSPVASAVKSVGAPGNYDWSSAGLLADILHFQATPTDNFGWILIGDEAVASSAKRFSTREEPDSSLRPTLTLTYQVPEPAGFIALGLFAGILSRRRRVTTS